MNSILQDYQTPFKTIPFDKITNSDFLPAIEDAIILGKQNIEKIKNNKETPTFSNTIEALEYADQEVELVANLFFNLHSAESNDEIQKIAEKFSPILSEYGNDISLDDDLFKRVKSVYDRKNDLNLNTEEEMLLEKQYRSFLRSGALLSEKDKARKRIISTRLSELSLHFSDHVLKDTNSFELIVDQKKDLDGIPEGVVAAASELAEKKEHSGKWIFSLQYPSLIPFMTYCKNRKLREKMAKASGSKSFHNDKYDNQEVIKEILSLKNENAKLLGFKDHACFVLEERMAQNPKTVFDFLNQFLDSALPLAKKDFDELINLAKEIDGIDDFNSWDNSYYSEILKEKKLKFNEEELKPYFKFENVVDGIFCVANKLYGLKFKERKDIATYHSDVLTYEVQDKNNRLVGVFYVDLFPREGKRNGAWMTNFKKQYKKGNEHFYPHVSIVCNFTRPTKEHPSLLTLNEVTTIFHEFGHALHGLLSDCTYPSLSSPDVYWDFVELPSQMMENFVFEKECLNLFAKHYKTGELMPEELILKVKKILQFQEGKNTLRQLSFSLLDMAWHTADPKTITNISQFEKKAMEKTSLLPFVEGTNMSCSFSHIFAGGYSAGYYSYKWAEVLDADAFESFKEKGIFDQETATSFRENILSKGGSIHPMELYKKFKGREPDPKALLRRAGLI